MFKTVEALFPEPVLECLLHGVAAYSAGAELGPAEWPHHDLLVVPRGTAWIEIRGDRVKCPTGTAILIPPHHPFRGRSGTDGCTLWVQHFRVRGGSRRNRLSLCPSIWLRGAAGAWPRLLMQRIADWHAEGASVRRGAHALPLLLDALAEAGEGSPEPSGQDGRIVRQALDRIEVHGFPSPAIAELATVCDRSESHLRAVFRRVTGRSLGAHLRDRRMNEAARLLCETSLPVKVIAERLGYSATEAFHRAFKQHHGMTPAAFHARHPQVV